MALAHPAAAQMARYEEVGRADGRTVYLDRVPAGRSELDGAPVIRTRAVMAFDPPQAQEGGITISQARYEIVVRCTDRAYTLVNWNAANPQGQVVGQATLPLPEDWQPANAQTQFGAVVEAACAAD